MADKKHIPLTRFRKYSTDWDKSIFSETFSTLSNNTLSRAQLNDETGSVRSLHYGDILVKFSETIDLSIDTIPFIADEANIPKNSLLENGDVVIADTAEDCTVGKCSEIINTVSLDVVSGLHTIPCRPKIRFARGYLGYFMNSPAYHDQLLPLMQGTKVSSISKTALQDTVLHYPQSFDEQAELVALFSQLNKLIDLQQFRYDKLDLLKKGMLQKMFPQNGENIPRVRFRGFCNAWKCRKFEDVFSERREKTTKENEDTLLSCAINGIFLNSELFSHFRGSSTIGYLKVKKNDLILSTQNLHLGNANINLRFNSGIISPAYKTYELVNCDPFFAHAWVKKEDTKDFFLSATTEGASLCRKNIEWDTLNKQTILVPDIEEQIKIGLYFKDLDKLLSLYQLELEKLQALKKALLSQMFI